MHTYIIDVQVSNPNVGSFRLVSSSVFVPSRKWNLKNPTVTMSMIDNLLRMIDNFEDWFITKRQELQKSARVAMEALLSKPRSFRNVLNLAIKFTKAIVLVPLCVLGFYAVILIRVGIACLICVPILSIIVIVLVGVRKLLTIDLDLQITELWFLIVCSLLTNCLFKWLNEFFVSFLFLQVTVGHTICSSQDETARGSRMPTSLTSSARGWQTILFHLSNHLVNPLHIGHSACGASNWKKIEEDLRVTMECM